MGLSYSHAKNQDAKYVPRSTDLPSAVHYATGNTVSITPSHFIGVFLIFFF